MKLRASVIPWLFGLALLPVGPAVLAQQPPPAQSMREENPPPPANRSDPSKSRSRLQHQLSELIRDDAGIVAPLPTRADEEGGVGESDREQGISPTLELEPMIVEGERVKPLPPPLRETKLQEVLRTGVVWEKVGHRFTRQLWMRGDRGIMFSIAW